ncbi:hypothetical protein EON64_15930 [archaeon]|nr:MAG: hypothetical protein EON64_15930 [archaeon]
MTSLEKLPTQDASRQQEIFAGLSSFGYSGTIAHVIIGRSASSFPIRRKLVRSHVGHSSQLRHLEKGGDCKQDIVDVVCDALKMAMKQQDDDVNPDQELESLGIDSFAATAFWSGMRAKLQLDLPIDIIYRFPTVRQLVAHINAMQGEVTSTTSHRSTDPILTAINAPSRPACSLIICPALGQPALAWREVAKQLVAKRWQVYVVSLPGKIDSFTNFTSHVGNTSTLSDFNM